MGMILSIAAGGALGALARDAVMTRAGQWFGLGFPMGTLAVNIVGSFTNFSTFSLDVVARIERGTYWLVAIYIAVSVVAAVAAPFGGMILFRWKLA